MPSPTEVNEDGQPASGAPPKDAGGGPDRGAGPPNTAQAAPESEFKDPNSGKPMTAKDQFVIALACVLPNVLLVLLLSDMGVGLPFYNALSPRILSLAGDGTAFLCSIVMSALYVSDWFYYKSRVTQVATATVPFLLIEAATCLKSRKYPWAPLLLTLLLIPGALGALRGTACKKTRRKAFYTSVSSTLFACGIAMIVAWVVWMSAGGHQWNRATKDDLARRSADIYKNADKDLKIDYQTMCHPELPDIPAALASFGPKRRAEISQACGIASSTWFQVWMTPGIVALSNLVAALFCVVNGVMLVSTDGQALVRALKRFIAALTMLFAGMYCSASLTGLAMGSTLMIFFGVGMVMVIVWTVVEVGPKVMANMMGESKFGQMLAQGWQNDWVRALFVGAVGIFIPIYFFLNMLNQRVRKYKGVADSDGRYTKQAQAILTEIATWNWASILTKIAILAELFFTLQVGVAKVTYVFLSWLSKRLLEVNLALVCLLVYGVGFIMFMLPPVPGIPVYGFTGIVIADQARRKLEGGGFWIGIAIACAVALICKLTACIGQYMIGVALGKRVKIQQLVKVDSVLTRAIEKILKRPGLNIGKVSILIGGPDWPVSVTCGILRLNVPQMLLGTIPVVLISSPCVAAGAFLSRSDSMWPMLAKMATVFAAVCQLVALLVAVALTTREVQDNHQELARPRPEHAAVAELTAREAHGNGVYRDVTSWNNLSVVDRVVLLAMVCSHLLAGFIFVMMASLCFRPFSVDKDIKASHEEGGLDGDALSIVLHPVGSGALGLFAFAVVMHVVHCKLMTRRTRREMKIAEAAGIGGVGCVQKTFE